MTWSKYGAEFFDECANAGLSDAATRTHAEAISWIYRVEANDLRILKHLVRRFAGSVNWESGIADLISVGFWADTGDAYQIIHHGDVIRASIAAQRNKRERDKKAQAAWRKRKGLSADVSTDVSDEASDDVSADADSQTAILEEVTANQTDGAADEELVDQLFYSSQAELDAYLARQRARSGS